MHKFPYLSLEICCGYSLEQLLQKDPIEYPQNVVVVFCLYIVIEKTRNVSV